MLLIVAVLVGLYGTALVIAGPITSGLFDVLGFGIDSGRIPDGAPRDYVLLIYGVLGSVLVGWMVLVAGMAAGPLHRGEHWAWWLLVASTSVWFVLDTTFSLAVGSWQHALFNVAFLVVLGIPLAGWRLAAQPPSAERAAATALR